MDTVLMLCIVTALLLICTCNLLLLTRLMGIGQRAADEAVERSEKEATTDETEAQKAALLYTQQFNEGLANLLNYDGMKKEADK